MTARLRSCSAPAITSAALAVDLFIKTVIGEESLLWLVDSKITSD